MKEIFFEWKNVSKRVLKDVSFKVYKGDRIMVFGPSGAGKTTLLHLFNRLEDPDRGEILFKNKSIKSYHVPLLRRKIGIVLQEANLFPGTVLDNLKYGPSLFNEWEEERAKLLLDYVNLPENYLNKDVDDLSGGEKQRVSLGRTLANKPDVLLLDEPTSALDDKNIEAIEEDLIRLMNEHNLTVIMITHNLKQAKRLGTKGMFIEEGEIKEFGHLPEIIENPKTESLRNFLDSGE